MSKKTEKENLYRRIAAELKKYAEDIAKLDARMLKFRNRIEEM